MRGIFRNPLPGPVRILPAQRGLCLALRAVGGREGRGLHTDRSSDLISQPLCPFLGTFGQTLRPTAASASPKHSRRSRTGLSQETQEVHSVTARHQNSSDPPGGEGQTDPSIVKELTLGAGRWKGPPLHLRGPLQVLPPTVLLT